MFVLGQCGAIKNDGVGMTELCHRVSEDAYTSEGPAWQREALEEAFVLDLK